MMDLIRKVQEQDWTAIEDLVKQAFATASYSDGTEAALVARLRQGPAFLPDLALMAEREAKPAGFILFTKERVSQETILALAPLAVKPCFQKSGIGTALVKKGHTLAAKAGFAYAAVLGDPAFYGRLGYEAAEKWGITPPAAFPKEYFMAIKLIPDAAPLAGTIVYDRAFGL